MHQILLLSIQWQDAQAARHKHNVVLWDWQNVLNAKIKLKLSTEGDEIMVSQNGPDHHKAPRQACVKKLDSELLRCTWQ